MNRRDSLKKIAIAGGALIALPSWANEWQAKDLHTGTFFSATEQELLASVADTIIPPGDSIGALSVGVDKFLQKLITQCYENETQANVKVQLEQLDATAQRTLNRSFNLCDQGQREEMLLKLASSENTAEKDFFNLMKSETIRGFNTSRDVMVKYLNFKPVPGHYYGCVDVKA